MRSFVKCDRLLHFGSNGGPGRNLGFYIFESLIYLKYTGKILDLLSKNSKSSEHFNDVAFYGIFRTVYYTSTHKYAKYQEHTLFLCNKLFSLEIISL